MVFYGLEPHTTISDTYNAASEYDEECYTAQKYSRLKLLDPYGLS